MARPLPLSFYYYGQYNEAPDPNPINVIEPQVRRAMRQGRGRGETPSRKKGG